MRLKQSAQRNETETKQRRNSFESVLFQFHFVVRTVLYAAKYGLYSEQDLSHMFYLHQCGSPPSPPRVGSKAEASLTSPKARYSTKQTFYYAFCVDF